jgi:hypothetical protein
MSAAAVDAVLRQAADFTERAVNTYEAEVAIGEVGVIGSAAASEQPILAQRAPTALIYGRVQSGKTAAMNLASALCLDNGFRVIVVLTADNVALVEQTANRFKAVDGPRVFSTVRDDFYEWEGQEDDIATDIANDGLILVCAKDAFHLPKVIQFLAQIDAPSYPSIVFDDEADAATPDTTLAARSSGRPNAPAIPSTIHRRVIVNTAPDEEGESITEILPHSLYVQVTATPFLLFLQAPLSRLRPTITFLLEPGEGYCGGEVFFANFDDSIRPASAPIVLVSDQEAQTIARRRVPTGLAASIDFFLVAAAAKAAQGGWPQTMKGFSHLSHTSSRIDQHTTVASHIDRHLSQLRRRLQANSEDAPELFQNAHDELRRTIPNAPPLADLVQAISDALRQYEVIRVNSKTDVPTYGPRVNFLVGGNILGRGLTIDDLLVTYYIREAQVSQMDTVWQHARMYGYRDQLMPYTRVFLPRRLARLFRGIHESEEHLRRLIRRLQAGENVAIRVAPRSRPSRPNAIDASALRVYGEGLAQLNPQSVESQPELALLVKQKLVDLGVPLDEPDREQRTRKIPVESMLELIEMVPIRDGDPGRWHPEDMSAIVESFRDRFVDGGPIYVRGLQRTEIEADGRARGRLAGPEIEIIRRAAEGVPALVLLHLGGSESPTGWYPTLVLPNGFPNFIVNPF